MENWVGDILVSGKTGSSIQLSKQMQEGNLERTEEVAFFGETGTVSGDRRKMSTSGCKENV